LFLPFWFFLCVVAVVVALAHVQLFFISNKKKSVRAQPSGNKRTNPLVVSFRLFVWYIASNTNRFFCWLLHAESKALKKKKRRERFFFSGSLPVFSSVLLCVFCVLCAVLFVSELDGDRSSFHPPPISFFLGGEGRPR
jgi:hypothetical protein